MEIRKVKSSKLVESNEGKVSLERGSVVYCMEELDNPEIESIMVSEKTNFKLEYRSDLFFWVEVEQATGDSKLDPGHEKSS